MAESVAYISSGLERGACILVSALESRARDGSADAWVSIPVNDEDLAQGYQDITFLQLNNYTNHAARWLSENLPADTEPFPCFAYAGPKDLRYPILALAAAKLEKVIVLPSPLVTPESQKKILLETNCGIYLRTSTMSEKVTAVKNKMPSIRVITVPDLSMFMKEETAPIYTYTKSWEEGKNDPWLVFHTSGTTGSPKSLIYTHHMMAIPGIVSMFSDMGECWVHQVSKKRLYTPLPSLHVIGMYLILGMTTFFDTVCVLGPSKPPTPETVVNVIEQGQVDTALLPPALIEELCLSSTGLEAVRKLSSVQFTGAPLAKRVGDLLVSHTKVIPVIGSTEAGDYLTMTHNKPDAWDYTPFHGRAGAVLEHRFDNLHELVFVRQHDNEMQTIFQRYPEVDRYETKDLWVEHPVHKGLWKIIGRADDHVSFSHGEGLHASRLEPEIESHPAVKSALIGGHGHPAPVLLIEPYPGAVDEHNKASFLTSLEPYIDLINSRVHDCVNLSSGRVIITENDKPFVRTLKGSIGRVQTLASYEEKISGLFV